MLLNVDSLISKLQKDAAVFEVKTYSNTVKNSHEASIEMQIDENIMAKSLLLKSENSYFLLLIPVTRKLDLNKVKNTLKRKADLATPQEVEDITGHKIGVVTPLNLKNQIPIYIDSILLKSERIGVGSGERGKEILLPPKNLIENFFAIPADLVLQ